MMCDRLRIARLLTAIAVAASIFACGGGSGKNSSGSSPANNTQAVIVNAGPAGIYANGLFTNVTVCAPGTSTCQNISGILVDTGSYGLRVLASALTVSLSQQKDGSGDSVGECAQFADGITWGPVKTADVKIAGEQAASIPIQVIDPSFATVPSSCSNHGSPEETLQALGANGILGIGPFIEDCGSACTSSNNNPGFYYGCAGSSCSVIGESGGNQVQNPVATFADGNGVIIDLPAVSGSAPTVSGSLIFGIGTQSDNALSGAQVFTLDNFGNFTTTYNSKSYTAFIDSGSNAYFFLDVATTGLTTCSNAAGFYCPSSPTKFSATTVGANQASSTINFTVDNANSLFANTGATAFATLGGPNPSAFDWGLPFFYGRKVYTAIEGKTTSGGTGPYWAY
jgi:hypothetical protein